MHPTSIQKGGINADSVLTADQLLAFLSQRRKAGGMWKVEKAALADAWYCELTGETRITPDPESGATATENGQHSATPAPHSETPGSAVIPQPTSRPKPRQLPKPYDGKGADVIVPVEPKYEVAEDHPLKSDGFMVFMLVMAIIAQILHTSTFFYFITPVDNVFLRYMIAVIVGVAVDSAALVTTIRRGNRLNLVIFAVCHFAVNMSAHFRFAEESEAIDVTAWHFYFDSVILSFLVSYAVYSYAETFAFKK